MILIKVLVVDDSIVFRKILEEALNKQIGIRVVGTAKNGKEALQLIRTHRPHLVVLDVEMPEMNGIQTLDEIRRQKLNVGVIMFSSLTLEGARTTLEALSKGAFDFVPKPSGTGAFAESVKKIQEDLVPKIRAYAEAQRITTPKPYLKPATAPSAPTVTPKTTTATQRPTLTPQGVPQRIATQTTSDKTPSAPPRMRTRAITPALKSGTCATPQAMPQPMRSARAGQIEIVGIGVSTGGPNALNEVIPRLPANFNLPVLLVQHMPPVFTTQLANRLNEKSKVRVVEAQEGMKIEPGTVYLAPGDYHMEVAVNGTERLITLNQKPPENSCRPAADVMFRSIAQVYGGRSLAVIMTGMGQDGFKGIQELKTKGACVIAQNQETCVVWGMPKFVVEAGLADRICPLNEIACAIVEITMTSKRPMMESGR